MSPTPEARAAREATRKKKRRAIAAVAVAVAVFLGGLVYVGVTVTLNSADTKALAQDVRDTQVDRLAIGNDTHRAAVNAATSAAQTAAILSLLTDCLEPTGTCAKRGAQTTAQVVEQIKLYIRDVAACSVLVADPSDVTSLEACVTNLEKETTGGTR